MGDNIFDFRLNHVLLYRVVILSIYIMIARAKPVAATPYRSKAEAEWAKVGTLYLLSLRPGRSVERMLYEPVTFHIPGGSYRTDFMAIMSDGELIFVEVKGSTRQRNYRDARSKLRAAAEVFPFFTFVQATGGAKGFEIEEIAP